MVSPQTKDTGSKRKSGGPVKYVLFRLPKNTSVSDLDGMEIDLVDLKVTSDKGFTAVSDRATIPERSSACPLIPDGDSLKCGGAFVAHVQLVRETEEPSKKKKKPSLGKEATSIKKGKAQKPSEAVKEQDSD